MEYDKLSSMLRARNRWGESFFHEACRANSVHLLHRVSIWMDEPDPVTLNVKNYNGEECTHIIARCKKTEATSMMAIVISLGADINGQEGFGGFTPLHLCVVENNYHLAKWICKEPGVNLEATNYGKQTAYHLAYERCDDNMMNILKHAGAKCEPPALEFIYSSEDESDDERNDRKKVEVDDESDILYPQTLSNLSNAMEGLII